MSTDATDRGTEEGVTTDSLAASPIATQDSSVLTWQWMVYSPRGGSTPGMFRGTDEATARGIYAAERERILNDAMLLEHDGSPSPIQQERLEALELRRKIVTDWQAVAP